MPRCPDCGDDTTKRMAIIEPSEIEAERDYCLTCDSFVDQEAREPSNEE